MFINTYLVVSPPPTLPLEEETTDMMRNRIQANSLEDIQRSQKAVDKDFIRARSFKNVKNTLRLLHEN